MQVHVLTAAAFDPLGLVMRLAFGSSTPMM